MKYSLGHVISEKGVVVDPAKIKAIITWPISKYVHDTISFMGLTRYYRNFIDIFSKIAHPITTLQKKHVRFVWSQQCQGIFDQLKHLLATTPILRTVDPNKDFVVCIDTSKDGLQGVLT